MGKLKFKDYDVLEDLKTVVLSEHMILKLLILNPSELKYSHRQVKLLTF